MKKYIITLTAEERTQLETMLAKGKAAVRKLTHARILLKADSSPGSPGWTDARISEALEVDVSTVANVRERFVLEGFEVALHGYSTRNHRQRRIDGEGEARLIAALCGPAPEGYARWSLRLLAYVHFYDLRGGGIETDFKNDNQGLGITKRNKKRFEAQHL